MLTGSVPMKDKLSVAILLNNKTNQQWICSAIDNLVKSGIADVHLFISKPPSIKNSSRPKQWSPAIPILRLIEKADLMIFRIRNNYDRLGDATAIRNIAGILDLIQGNNQPDDLPVGLGQSLGSIKPDIIVSFGHHNLAEAITTLPRYGVWRFSVDSAAIPGGFDYGFWEVVRYKQVSYVSVEVIEKSEYEEETIYMSIESTCPFSITRNRNKLFHRAALFLPRLVEGLIRFEDVYIASQKLRHRDFRGLGSDELIRLDMKSVLRDVSSYLLRVFRLVVNKLIYTDAFSWQVMILVNGDEKPCPVDFSCFKPLTSPRGVFWADPFVISEYGRYFIFVEEYIYKRNSAHISVVEIDREGGLVSHRKIIEKPYHMSYPFIFREGDTYYMIPETSANNSIELYRCLQFPDKWEYEKKLMDHISATDTTLFSYNSRWWLFTTIDKTGSVSGGSTELFLFYSDNPVTGQWTSHPLNPVVSDERRARCAGNLFIDNGIIYRPSQDCSVRYGRGLNLNRVTELNETGYSEVLEKEIKPTWSNNLKGIHTLNFANGITVTDTYTYQSRL